MSDVLQREDYDEFDQWVYDNELALPVFLPRREDDRRSFRMWREAIVGGYRGDWDKRIFLVTVLYAGAALAQMCAWLRTRPAALPLAFRGWEHG